MSLFLPIIFILIGFILLMWSADLLVDNASILAEHFGVSAFLVGVLIIGFGTSAPEMFVSAMAALENKGNLALGNALGSNITNIGLVLGSAAVVKQLTVARSTAMKDIPIVILTGVIAIGLIYDGELSQLDGVILLIILASYLVWTSLNSKNDTPNQAANDTDPQIKTDELEPGSPSKKKSVALAFILTISSIALLVIASRALVHGAVSIATLLEINELIIGLTIVAIGTSLPELAAAIAAARKGAHEMIIGNIIGSNVFNILGVLGISGVIRATETEVSAINRDFPMMFFFSLLMMIFALSKGKLSRNEGGLLLVTYFVYICYLVISALQ